ncbi:MAG TPA: hypothetical protein PLW95_03715 [bacterium]|nr:hypothetical protein [bacterium]
MKILKKIIALVIVVIILGAGFIYWQKYTEKQRIKLAEEEKRKQEEIEREKQRQFLEQKKQEYYSLIDEMRKYFRQGDYKKVKEIAENSFALAKDFNFDTTEINKILHQIEVINYQRKLEQLDKDNKDIFNYSYVRNELLKIPSLEELTSLKNKIYQKTFQNEYLVLLELAEKHAIDGKQGKNSKINYFLSKDYLYKAQNLRKTKNLKQDIKREEKIAEIQKDVFFAFNQFKENTIPSSLYQ